MKHKKILLGSMSTVMAVAAPVATVVACGNAKKANQNEIIDVNVNIDSALKYAKKEATVYNQQNTSATRKDPFGYLIGNVVEQLLDQIGNQVPSIKNISTKLKAKNKAGFTFYQVIGKEIKDKIFETKLINDRDNENNNKSLTSLVKLLLEPTTLLSKIGGLKGALEVFKKFENGNNPFSGAPFANDDEKNKIFQQISEKFSLDGYATIALMLTSFYPGDTLNAIVNSTLSSIGSIFDLAGIKASDFMNVINEINNKIIKIDINIFGEHMKFKTPKIKIASNMKKTLEKILLDKDTSVQTVFAQLIKEIQKELVKSIDQKKTLNQMIIDGLNKSSAGGTKTAYVGPDSYAADPIQDILKKVPQLFSSGAIETLIDLLTFITDIADNNKVTNSFAFEEQKNIDIFKGITKQFAPGQEKIVNVVFKLFKELAALYK